LDWIADIAGCISGTALYLIMNRIFVKRLKEEHDDLKKNSS
jgi:hypothetical protein